MTTVCTHTQQEEEEWEEGPGRLHGNVSRVNLPRPARWHMRSSGKVPGKHSKQQSCEVFEFIPVSFHKSTSTIKQEQFCKKSFQLPEIN